MDLDSVLNWLRGGASANTPKFPTDPSKAIPAPNNPPYPTGEDVEFARQQDYSYGQPWAPEFEGKSLRAISEPRYTNIDVPPKSTVYGGHNADALYATQPYRFEPIKDAHAKAALAVERSALAKLGYDPNKVALDDRRDPAKMNYLGAYLPKADSIYANAYDSPSIVHESIHRGVQKLKESPYWHKDFDFFDSNLNNETRRFNEYLVRHLMTTKMGNPEMKYPSNQIPWADYEFNKSAYGDARKKILQRMEDAAAQYIAAKHPGGPR